jgi:hypothetical protein
MKFWKFRFLRVAFARIGWLMFTVDLAADSHGFGRFAAIHVKGHRLITIPLSRS